MKRLSAVFVRCLAVVGVLLSGNACLAEDLTIPGSGNPEYVLRRLAGEFNGQQKQHRVIVPPSSGTAGALRDVGEGISSLGRVGRPLKDEEKAKGFAFLPIGIDPVVMVGGAGVTVRGLSQQQVLDIYSGKLTNWSEVGGKSAPIRAIGREVTDASRQALQQLIKPLKDIQFGSNVKVAHLDPQVVELLDRYPTSLAFLNRSALSACQTKVVPLAIDGVVPTLESVEQGRYPVMLEFGLVYRTASGLSPAGRAFVEFIRSPAGRGILTQSGVLPR